MPLDIQVYRTLTDVKKGSLRDVLSDYCWPIRYSFFHITPPDAVFLPVGYSVGSSEPDITDDKVKWWFSTVNCEVHHRLHWKKVIKWAPKEDSNVARIAIDLKSAFPVGVFCVAGQFPSLDNLFNRDIVTPQDESDAMQSVALQIGQKSFTPKKKKGSFMKYKGKPITSTTFKELFGD